MGDDEPALGEQMNRDLYLDPGFTPDRDGLVRAVRADIDDTVERAQAAVERRRGEEAQAHIAGEEPGSADEP